MDRLTDAQQATLILRLVLNSRGYLLHGEMLNLQGNTRTQFKAWVELMKVLQQEIPDYENRDMLDQA